MELNLFRNRITNKIIMPDGVFTLCIVNCTNRDLYMMNVRGDGIEKLKPIEDIIDGEKIDLKWHDKLAYGWLISKHFLNGLPQRCDDTIKVFAVHQTIVSSSMEKDKIVRDFSLVATYNVNKQVWKDANYIPIVEMNTVVSFDYDFLEQMLLQFESAGEGVMAMIEGKLTQYDGLVTNLINCSENDYFTVVEQQIIPVPSINSYDWFTNGEDSQFGLNDEYREEAEEKWKSSIMKEFGLSKSQALEGHDIFVSVTASHDYPRRKMTLRNLPKDKTYQKVVYQVRRVLEENTEEYLRPFFVAGSNLPIFRSKKAAELFIKVFKGKMSLYYGAQHSIHVKRMADYKIDMMRAKYIRKEKSVVKTAKRFVISSFVDKSFEIVCSGVMRFLDFLLGKGAKAAKRASDVAKAGKVFYKASSKMFTMGLLGENGSYCFDNGADEKMKPVKETPINKKAKANDDFGHFMAKTPGSYREKEKEAEKMFNFDRELKRVEAEEEYKFDDKNIDGDRYFDLSGVPIKNLETLMNYNATGNGMGRYYDVHGILKYRTKAGSKDWKYIPYVDGIIKHGQEEWQDDIDWEKLEDYKKKLTNSKSTVYVIDFDKIMKINEKMEKAAESIRETQQAIKNEMKGEAQRLAYEQLLKAKKGAFVKLRNERDYEIMKSVPEYIQLRGIMKSSPDFSRDGEIATTGSMMAAEENDGVGAIMDFVPPKDNPYITKEEYVSATPSYKEIVNERMNLDNGEDERWQTDRLETEEMYEEDQLSQKRTGKKGFFRRVFDKIKSIWCSRPAKIIRRVVGLGLAITGIWRAINRWKDLAEAIMCF